MNATAEKNTQNFVGNGSAKVGVFPLPVLMGDGSFSVVHIPTMTDAAFEFFKKALDTYKAAIVPPPPQTNT